MTSPPVHPVLIVNARSGGGKAERNDLVRQCGARASRPSRSGSVTTSRHWRPRRSRAAPTPLAWRAVTDRKGQLLLSPRRTTSRSSVCLPARATISPSTSASTATTSWARSTRSPTGTNGASTSAGSTVACSSTTSPWVCTASSCSRPRTGAQGPHGHRDVARRARSGRRAVRPPIRRPDGRVHDTALLVLVSNNRYAIDPAAAARHEGRHRRRRARRRRGHGAAARWRVGMDNPHLSGRLRRRNRDGDRRRERGARTPARFRVDPEGVTRPGA